LQGAIRIAPKHAGILADVDRLAVIPGNAPDDPSDDAAQAAVGRVHDLQLVGGAAKALQNGRPGAGVAHSYGGMDQLLGILDEVERLPFRVYELPI
jgi:hypothetical protein